MAIPTPEPGLVISYSYVWGHEAEAGEEEGRKNRPCVVALAVRRQQDDETLVTVLPVTHRAPQNPLAAIEIPPAIKRHLGLDEDPSWIVVTEGDQFIWPGYDLRKAHGSNRYDYGFLPPRFFESVLAAFRAWHRANRAQIISRE